MNRRFGFRLKRKRRPANPDTDLWYLTTGVVAADVICAYKPKGAVSLAASYSNLANPGTQDAIATVPPTWNSTDGWIFNGTDQYLDTGAYPTSDWSVLIKFSDFSLLGRYLLGVEDYDINGMFSFGDNSSLHDVYYIGVDTIVTVHASIVGGVRGISQYQPYLNGLVDGSPATTTVWGAVNASLIIGAYQWIMSPDPAAIESFSAVKVQALSLYNKPLNATQMLAISTAMAGSTPT
jgi:hypothetical protein